MQFGRLLTLTVGNQSQAIQIVYDERIGEKPTINATIKKTNKKEPNTANISIDNLSENIRNRISSKEFNLVKLDVGWYGEELRTIFVGSIDKHDHIREAESATTALAASNVFFMLMPLFKLSQKALRKLPKRC